MQSKTLLFAALFLICTCCFAQPSWAKGKSKQAVPAQPTSPSNTSEVLSKFKNCKEAHAAGVSNVPVAPGYTPLGWKHSSDRDKDGIACEKK